MNPFEFKLLTCLCIVIHSTKYPFFLGGKLDSSFLYGYPKQDVARIIYFHFNGLTGAAKYLLPLLLLLFIIVFFHILSMKKKSWKQSKKCDYSIKRTDLFKNIFINILFQRRTNNSAYAAIMHSLFFIPGLTLLTLEIIYFFDIYFVTAIFQNRMLTGKLYLAWTFSVELSAIMIISGISISLYRRLVLRPSNIRSTKSDYFFLSYITIMLFLIFLKQALLINLNDFPEFEKWSFISYPFSHLFTNSNPAALEFLYSGAWYIFAFMFFATFIIFHKTKFGHFIFGSLNLAITSQTKFNVSKKFLYPFDNSLIFENKSQPAGENSLLNFDCKDRLEIDSCLRCGRCHRYCTAVIAEKKLSPLAIMEKLKLLSSQNKLNTDFIPEYFSHDEINDCYSCGACSEACPVLSDPMKKIESIKKFQTSMNGNVSPAIADLFSKIDFYGNIYGKYDHDMAYSSQIKAPHVSAVKKSDYVLFLGCRGKSSPHTIDMINKFCAITEKANISVSILGSDEECCGDALLHQGNEFLFREKALKNLASFEKFSVKNIITFCPHGYNILKKEYKHILKEKFSTYDYSVFHYTEILNQLLNENLITLKNKTNKNIVYHDPCYLGRFNLKFNDSRDIMHRVSNGIIFEMNSSMNKSICCGGGAGKFTEKEKSGHNPNDIIVREAYDTGANILASACPICIEQFNESLQNMTDLNIQVKDLLELVFECME